MASGAARPVPPMRNSERAFTDRHTTTHSAIPVATAMAAEPTAHIDWLPPPHRSWCERRSLMPSDCATTAACAESPTRWHATPSTSATVSPASSSAARMARSARVNVLTPESREYSVRPTPTIAARSRNRWESLMPRDPPFWSAACTHSVPAADQNAEEEGCASRQVDPGRLDAGVLEDGLQARVLAVAGVAEATERQCPVDAAVRVHPHRARV